MVEITNPIKSAPNKLSNGPMDGMVRMGRKRFTDVLGLAYGLNRELPAVKDGPTQWNTVCISGGIYQSGIRI